jgi:hypothetical protein
MSTVVLSGVDPDFLVKQKQWLKSKEDCAEKQALLRMVNTVSENLTNAEKVNKASRVFTLDSEF